MYVLFVRLRDSPSQHGLLKSHKTDALHEYWTHPPNVREDMDS